MVETWDVMGPSHWFLIITDDGTRIQARTHTLRTAIVMVQELLGDEETVMAVFDGQHLYWVNWDL